MAGKQGRPTKAQAQQRAAERAAEEATAGMTIPDVDAEDESLSPGWDERFEAWRGGLGDDADVISIYAYSFEKAGGQERRRQEFIWKISSDGDFPDFHQIGITLGGGDFDLIARAKGKNILQRRVYFGKAYNDLREEALADLKAARSAQAAVNAPVQQNPAQDPFAMLERLGGMFIPIAKEWIKNSNPMNQVRAMSEMGEEMARRNFDFSMKITKAAADKRLADQEDEEDDEDEEQQVRPGAAAGGVSPEKQPGWEAKLSQIADLIIAKGEDFINAKGAEKAFMKKAILNDEGFQAMLKNPESTKAALTRLYKKCGVSTVNGVLEELGIMAPKPMNGAARPAAASGSRPKARV